MSLENGQILRQSSSYRQGLVLGLTMAEIMLLLVFCLLIAMATFIFKEQEKRRAADKQIEQLLADKRRSQDLAQTLNRSEALIEKLKAVAGSNDPQAIDKYWRELVEGRAAADELQKAGVTLADVRERMADIKALDAKGIDVQTAVKDILNRAASGTAASGHQWPPIISLSEAGGNFFKSGSAELSPQFRESLMTTIPAKVSRYIKEFDVDVIEVVGHTDEQPLGIHQSNLDRDLLSVLKGQTDVAKLIPADNAGLGLARAVSVVSVLKQNLELANYKLIPLSGAQLVNTDDTLAILGIPANIPERRRIEIRLRKSSPHEAAAILVPPPQTSVGIKRPTVRRRAPPISSAPISLLPNQPPQRAPTSTQN